jgi:glycine cleavage system H protein
MSANLVFMMGEFEVRIPMDRMYSENHLWLKPSGDSYQVGFTAYSVRLLQDVYFLDWSIDPNTEVQHRKEIGEIESSKALSSLYSPFSGRVLEFNESLLEDPSTINTDNYGAGWLFHFQTESPPLGPEKYVKLLEGGWEETQRHLKGQIN